MVRRLRSHRPLAAPVGLAVELRRHSYYDCSVEIHSAARKHGCADSDVQHAVEHQLVVNDLGDDNSPHRLLVIGPDRAGNLLEIIVLIFDDER